MPKNVLKNLGRFELLEMIYAMRKENLELKQRCDAAEKLVAETKADAEKQIDKARIDYENRIEELRMQGAAKDLQIRMKKIEEQLRLLQKLTSVDVELPDVDLLSQEIAEGEAPAKDAEEKPEAEGEGKA